VSRQAILTENSPHRFSALIWVVRLGRRDAIADHSQNGAGASRLTTLPSSKRVALKHRPTPTFIPAWTHPTCNGRLHYRDRQRLLIWPITPVSLLDRAPQPLVASHRSTALFRGGGSYRSESLIISVLSKGAREARRMAQDYRGIAVSSPAAAKQVHSPAAQAPSSPAPQAKLAVRDGRVARKRNRRTHSPRGTVARRPVRPRCATKGPIRLLR
jgi:hypothetical protein